MGFPNPAGSIPPFPENQKIGMVLPGVYLTFCTTDSRTVFADDYEQVFGDKSRAFIIKHDFDMRKSLSVGTDLVLTLDNTHSAVAQYAMCFTSGLLIQFQNGFVILGFGLISGPIVSVMLLECVVRGMCGTAGAMHVGRINDHTVQCFIVIRQLPAINPGQYVRWKQIILIFGNVFARMPPCRMSHLLPYCPVSRRVPVSVGRSGRCCPYRH